MNGEQRPTEGKPTAGQAFVKSIRPAGCALFLVLAVLVTAICRLEQVLEEQVFPKLPQYGLDAEVTGDTVTVTVTGNLAAARSAILRYFPEDLITFERG